MTARVTGRRCKLLQKRLSVKYFEVLLAANGPDAIAIARRADATSSWRSIYRRRQAAIASLRAQRDRQRGAAIASLRRRQHFHVICREDPLKDRLRNVADDGRAHAVPTDVIGVIVALGKTVTVV
jgi:hypothetical protein